MASQTLSGEQKRGHGRVKSFPAGRRAGPSSNLPLTLIARKHSFSVCYYDLIKPKPPGRRKPGPLELAGKVGRADRGPGQEAQKTTVGSDPEVQPPQAPGTPPIGVHISG